MPTAEMGAVRVVELMKAADATVAKAGAKALNEIAISGGKQLVFEAGGVAALMDVMARHKTHAGVCAEASYALASIAFGSEARAQAVLEALALLLEVMELHKTNADVCFGVSYALYNIAYDGGASCRASIVSAGAVPLLAAVRKNHPGFARDQAHDALDALGY